MRRYIMAALITAAIVIVATPLLGLALIYVGFHGGIRGAILSLTPRPNLERDDIKGKRAKLRAEIESAFVEVMANTEFVAYETSSHDICYDGTHTSVRVDQFAHRCTLRLTRFYGFDDSFRDKMVDFERRVLAGGWDFPRWGGWPMEGYMKNYYDVRHLRKNPSMAVDFVARPGEYHFDDGKLAMRIAWAERASQRDGVGANSLYAVQRSSSSLTPKFLEQSNVHDADEVIERVTRDRRYVLAVAIYGHYFED
jgi:hypothetical protein